MTHPERPDETLTAALIQISGHAERIAALDHRYHEIAGTLSDVATQAAAAAVRADNSTATQATILASLDTLERQVSALAPRLTALTAGEHEPDSGRYQPVPPPRWWRITGPEREQCLDRLRAWVTHIYRPGYGKLAALLPPCWEEHPTCLNALDWLSELWSVLYLTAERSPDILAAQAEWQTRLLPAAADQMAAEADGCQHTPPATRGLPPRARTNQ